MRVKIKKLSDKAQIPSYAHVGDAGMDIIATSLSITADYVEYGTDLAFEIPEGYCMLIFPRSSNSKKDLLLANSVGVLDSTYRGELRLRFKRYYRPTANSFYSGDRYVVESYNTFDGSNIWVDSTKWYEVGDKIRQIIILPYPTIEFDEVDSLSETDRGEGGFGSSGK